MAIENGVPELGRDDTPRLGKAREEVPETGQESGVTPATPQPLSLFMRTKDEAMAYAAEEYPWLSKVILPDALYRLARDILFRK